MNPRVAMRLRKIDMMLEQMYVISPKRECGYVSVVEREDSATQTNNWRFEVPYSCTVAPKICPREKDKDDDPIRVKLKRVTPEPKKRVREVVVVPPPRKRVQNQLERQNSVDFVPEHLIPYWDNRVILSTGEEGRPHLRFRKP